MNAPRATDRALDGDVLDDGDALALAHSDDLATLMRRAGALRDEGHGKVITHSRKVFVPLTRLCRDVCHYCTFATTPHNLDAPYLSVDAVLRLCEEGARLGCQEALFTLGERPELRYQAARDVLAQMGFASTLDYVRHVAARVLEETGLLPHVNAGCMDETEMAALRSVSPSMGLMLESASERLCGKGMPHHGSPDKQPAERLRTIDTAGRLAVPFTTGILVGIGETRRERIESLLALRASHRRYGHIQEIIIQNFRAKPDTRMAAHPEPGLTELLWTVAVARLIFGPKMSIQAPPNLSPGALPQLLAAGVNDWGGVSPLTPDHVNPEAPWPHLEELARLTATAGKSLEQRLTIYPAYIAARETWLAPVLHTPVLRHCDSENYARGERWRSGQPGVLPVRECTLLQQTPDSAGVDADLRRILGQCHDRAALSEVDIARLFRVRGAEFAHVVREADALRHAVNGDTVSYVVNRNINYTNVCTYGCRFCAFSKGGSRPFGRERPYDISGDEIARRCHEAWQRGATEVCLQGGIHPGYTGQTYLDILHTVRTATPSMHIHAFSPLEVHHGATTLGLSIRAFLLKLKAAGLNTLPGTAAEILDDSVRAVLCPDKIDSARWLDIMQTAHEEGLRTTATIMFGHVDGPVHWARHLLALRALQARTGGFTELVPLPFVAEEAPLYRDGLARPGPTFRESVLMHAVCRLVMHGFIDNIQTSWVKMGLEGARLCLAAGANDLGGTLMNESITRAAGAQHGQEITPETMEAFIRESGRTPRMRNTVYGTASQQHGQATFAIQVLDALHQSPAGKKPVGKRIVRSSLACG